MKKIIFIFYTFISFQLFSQRNEPERGDNVIILHNNLKADSNFILCSKHLALKGYSFEIRDKELSQLVTSSKNINVTTQYKLTILCLDNQIKFRATLGQINFMLSTTPIWIDWKYSNSNSNAYTKVYNNFFPDLLELKKSIANCTGEYKKE